MLPSSPSPVRAIMIFADDPPSVADWYASAWSCGPVQAAPNSSFRYFMVGNVEVAFHPADPDANPYGRSTVVYWAVDSVAVARYALLAKGATPLRGPLQIDDNRFICQVVDPFGNVIGLDGPA
ncbi:VOC family protein [Actinoplanes sp. CA-252034]|uniref:VOC family protein n=1 Tax=Actinoplanes sp. CA-252034 TaxID=3239906 RepID=UPI003D990E4A